MGELPGEPTEDQVLASFRAYGFEGVIEELDPRAEDEAVFFVSSVDILAGDALAMTKWLVGALGRKVWITTRGPDWSRSRVRVVGADASSE